MQRTPIVRARKLPGVLSFTFTVAVIAVGVPPAAADRPDVLWIRGGHAADVASVGVTSDGDRIVSGGLDGTIKVWDFDSGALSHSIRQNGASALSADGSMIALAAFGPSGGRIDIRSVADGALVRSFGSLAAGSAIATWSAAGDAVLETGANGLMRLWDVDLGTVRRSFSGHTSLIRCAAWSPDGTYFVTGAGVQGVDNTVRIWSPTSSTPVRTITGHLNYVGSVAISPDSQRIATGSGDNTVKIWDAATGGLVRTFSGLGWPAWSVAYSPDGSRLASVDIGGTLRIWDSASGSPVLSLLLPNGGRCVRYAPDGQLVIGTGRGTIELRDATSGALARSLGDFTHELEGLRYSEDGRRLIFGETSFLDVTASVVDARTGQTHASMLLPGFSGEHGPIFSPDLSIAGTINPSSSTQANMCRMDDGSIARTLSGHISVLFDMAFSPDGQFFASAGEYQSGLWNVATGQFIRWYVDDFSASNHAVTFSADGQRIALGNREFAQVFAVSGGPALHSFDLNVSFVTAVAFSPDGSMLAAASPERIGVWRLDTNTPLWSVTNPEGAGAALLFSGDGTRVISGGRDGVIQFRSALTGAALLTFDEETGSSIKNLALHPSERTIAYTRGDATIVVVRNPFWIVGDTNGDSCVDLGDLSRLLGSFGSLEDGISDFNDDGAVDIADLAMLLGNFGDCP
ncbi:MAG: hypothetical protein IT450_00945 [Phycisphaerales bacterium]|nr:hypothetical protein [Phycisphaerales bacterium]